jgi:hypothetical protein
MCNTPHLRRRVSFVVVDDEPGEGVSNNIPFSPPGEESVSIPPPPGCCLSIE